jgi:hypothetical protein
MHYNKMNRGLKIHRLYWLLREHMKLGKYIYPKKKKKPVHPQGSHNVIHRGVQDQEMKKMWVQDTCTIIKGIEASKCIDYIPSCRSTKNGETNSEKHKTKKGTIIASMSK